jgi:hypothetical protein
MLLSLSKGRIEEKQLSIAELEFAESLGAIRSFAVIFREAAELF